MKLGGSLILDNKLGIGKDPTQELTLKSQSLDSDIVDIYNPSNIKIFNLTNDASGHGYFEVSDNAGTTKILLGTTSGLGIIGTMSNHPLLLKTNNTEGMRIASDGKVGIGRTSEVYKMEVGGILGILDIATNWSGLAFRPNATLDGLNANFIDTVNSGSGVNRSLCLRVNSLNCLIVDTLGRITMNNQSRVRAYRSGTNQSVPPNADIALIFNSESYDTQSEYNTGTGIFTAGIAGRYLFNVTLTFNAGGAETYILRVFKNGSYWTNRYTGSLAAGYHFIYFNDTLDLLPGDWIQITIHQQAAGNRDLVLGADYSLLTINKIS